MEVQLRFSSSSKSVSGWLDHGECPRGDHHGYISLANQTLALIKVMSGEYRGFRIFQLQGSNRVSISEIADAFKVSTLKVSGINLVTLST